MRSIAQWLIIILCIVTAGVLATKYVASSITSLPENTFQRVIRENTLRCGYYVFPPLTMRDPNTGKLSGLSIDMMDYLTKKTGLKVEWTEEITFGNWVPALQAKRFDAVCTPLWADVSYGRVVKFSRAMVYAAIEPLVRIDETRFGTSASELNTRDVTIIVQEGNMTDSLARELFPKAKITSLPGGADYGTLLQNVIDHKADVVLWDRNGLFHYQKNNPGKIKILPLDKPLKLIPFELPALQGESDLRDFFDALIEDMLNTGEMDRLVDRWQDARGSYFSVALPYQPPKP